MVENILENCPLSEHRLNDRLGRRLSRRWRSLAVVHEFLHELRLDVRPHNEAAAYADAALHAQARQFGRGLGDQACLAVTPTLRLPVLITDREWQKIEVGGLVIEQLR